jgi:hypothetical protein
VKREFTTEITEGHGGDAGTGDWGLGTGEEKTKSGKAKSENTEKRFTTEAQRAQRRKGLGAEQAEREGCGVGTGVGEEVVGCFRISIDHFATWPLDHFRP